MRAHRVVAIAGAALLMPGAATAQHRHDTHPQEHHRSAPPDTGTAQRAALERQLEAVRRTTSRYRDIEAAKADGFVRFGRLEGALMGEHWYLKGAPEPVSPESLDLEHPTTLQYATIDGARVLIGVAFSVRLRPDEPLPAGFAGDEDRWHRHDVVKLMNAATVDRPVLRWLASRAVDKRRRDGDDRTMLTMVHAWVWLENPDGPFAMHHRVLPYLKAGLPDEWAKLPGADEAAARGIGLVTEDGCRIALAGELWMAHASRGQTRTIMRECEARAEEVRQALDRRPTGSAANAAARAAWLAVEATKQRVLSDDQRARIAAVTEHHM